MTGLVLSSLLLLSSIKNVFGVRGYVGVAEKLDGFHAEQYCRNTYGSNLATITSAQENEDAREACREVSGVTGECYIGLVRDSAFDEWQFTSSNIDSTPRGYSNWNKLCAIFSSLKNGRWDAEPCDNTVRKYPFVCDTNYADPQSYCDIEFSAWYRADAYNLETKTWQDLSGNGLDSTIRAGAATCLTGDDGLNGQTVVQGDQSTRFYWGSPLQKVYSFFSVARYAKGANNRGRIFDGTSNWLSGFWSSQVGVAHHEGWLTSHNSNRYPLDTWIISSDEPGVYRANGKSWRTVGDGNLNSVPGQIQTNTRDQSDFEIAEVIMVNAIKLDENKICCIEDYLSKRYDIAVESTYDGKESVPGFPAWFNFNEGEGIVKNPSGGTRGNPQNGPSYINATEDILIYIIAALVLLNVVCIARYCIYSKNDSRIKYKTVSMDSSTDADV